MTGLSSFVFFVNLNKVKSSIVLLLLFRISRRLKVLNVWFIPDTYFKMEWTWFRMLKNCFWNYYLYCLCYVWSCNIWPWFICLCCSDTHCYDYLLYCLENSQFYSGKSWFLGSEICHFGLLFILWWNRVWQYNVTDFQYNVWQYNVTFFVSISLSVLVSENRTWRSVFLKTILAFLQKLKEHYRTVFSPSSLADVI